MGKKLGFGCLGVLVAFALPVFLFLAVISAIFGAAQQTLYPAQAPSSTATLITPMPDLATALKNPAYAGVIIAAQKVSGVPQNLIGTPEGVNSRMQMLLAMAWEDSQWGTQANANPIGSSNPGIAVAQAAIHAGLQPSNPNFIYAVAISHAESSWNPDIALCDTTMQDYTYPSAAFESCPNEDVGVWAINTSTSGRNGVSRDSLINLDTNATAMMQISSNGTNWGPWCTAWSGGSCSKGTLLGCPGSAFCPYIPLAQQIAAQVAGQSLGGSYSGMILMLSSQWPKQMQAQGFPASTNPNDPANALQVMTVVNALLPKSNDLTALNTYYNTGVSPPNTTTIPAHSQMVMDVYNAGFGGLNPVRSQIASIAASQVGTAASGNQCVPYWSSCGEPWCAIFATWVWHKAGIGITDIPYTGNIVAWATSHNQWVPVAQNPQVGDIAIWAPASPGSPPSGNPPTTVGTLHASIVVAVNANDGQIQTIDGNYGNQVTLRTWYNPHTFYDSSNGGMIEGYASPIAIGS